MVSLWLDDMDHEQQPIPFGWVHVRTVEEAQTALLNGDVQKMSLDHDLGACLECTKAAMRCMDCGERGIAHMNGREHGSLEHSWICDECGGKCWADWDGMMANCIHFGTGYDLVLWMAEYNHWPAEKPTVHSLNPVGRARMEGTIERYFSTS